MVFDSIIYERQKQERSYPNGLDVMAALGNAEAVYQLESELRKYNYSANLLAARKTVAEVSPEKRSASIGGRWLQA